MYEQQQGAGVGNGGGDGSILDQTRFQTANHSEPSIKGPLVKKGKMRKDKESSNSNLHGRKETLGRHKGWFKNKKKPR